MKPESLKTLLSPNASIRISCFGTQFMRKPVQKGLEIPLNRFLQSFLAIDYVPSDWGDETEIELPGFHCAMSCLNITRKESRGSPYGWTIGSCGGEEPIQMFSNVYLLFLDSEDKKSRLDQRLLSHVLACLSWGPEFSASLQFIAIVSDAPEPPKIDVSILKNKIDIPTPSKGMPLESWWQPNLQSLPQAEDHDDYSFSQSYSNCKTWMQWTAIMMQKDKDREFEGRYTCSPMYSFMESNNVKLWGVVPPIVTYHVNSKDQETYPKQLEKIKVDIASRIDRNRRIQLAYLKTRRVDWNSRIEFLPEWLYFHKIRVDPDLLPLVLLNHARSIKNSIAYRLPDEMFFLIYDAFYNRF